MAEPVFPPDDGVVYEWRFPVLDGDVEGLHAEAFGGAGYAWSQARPLSLGWVSAQQQTRLVGFLNVAWDGDQHAFLLDLAVAADRQRGGVGRNLVVRALVECRRAGCEWVHVDYEPHLDAFYAACGFTPTAAGLYRVG
jgi:predicted N-acetyltransferase YhbS